MYLLGTFKSRRRVCFWSLGKGSYIWTLSPWPVTYQPQPYGVFKLSSVRFAISLTDPSSLRIVMIIISHKSTSYLPKSSLLRPICFFAARHQVASCLWRQFSFYTTCANLSVRVRVRLSSSSLSWASSSSSPPLKLSSSSSHLIWSDDIQFFSDNI